MTTRIFIISNRLTPTERAVAEELMAAQLDRHLDDRARYLTPSPNAEIAARLAQDSGAGTTQDPPGIMVDAGAPPARQTLHYSDSGSPQARGQELVDGSSPLPAKTPTTPAVVAWDLTLRCPACGSGVEGNVREYHCPQCAKKGLTSREMVEAERSFENGLIRYTSRGAVRQRGER